MKVENPDLLMWLVVGHLVGDFLFQTNWMANGKTERILPLATHALVYTTTIGLFSLPVKCLNYMSLLIIFLSHFFLDQRRFVKWWIRIVNGKGAPQWIVIMVDQTWHLLVLAFITFFFEKY